MEYEIKITRERRKNVRVRRGMKRMSAMKEKGEDKEKEE